MPVQGDCDLDPRQECTAAAQSSLHLHSEARGRRGGLLQRRGRWGMFLQEWTQEAPNLTPLRKPSSTGWKASLHTGSLGLSWKAQLPPAQVLESTHHWKDQLPAAQAPTLRQLPGAAMAVLMDTGQLTLPSAPKPRPALTMFSVSLAFPAKKASWWCLVWILRPKALLLAQAWDPSGRPSGSCWHEPDHTSLPVITLSGNFQGSSGFQPPSSPCSPLPLHGACFLILP